MLEVICVGGGSKKVIKGQKYMVESLWEDSGWKNTTQPSIQHNGKLVLRRQIRLKGGNTYYVEKFNPVDGRSFYDIPVFGNKNYWYNDNVVKPDDKDYTGQYVLCREDRNSKYLKSGEKYYVEEHRKIEVLRYGGSSINHTFKLKGLKRYINTYGFDEIPLKEQRKLKLDSIAGEEITSGLTKRKFLYFSEIKKTKILVELYLKALINLETVESLEGITIIDVMVDLGKIYDIDKDDVKSFITKSLSKISKDLGFL